MHVNAKKSLGQNFLVNPHILDKIISAAEVTKNDTILEIGPGTGNLTKKLAEKADRVIAVEKDHRLIKTLEETFRTSSNVEIVEGDILKLEIEKLFENCKLKTENCHFKVVANIPYYITSRFLRILLEEWPKPELVVLTVQKEVAMRIIAKPPHMNLLALSVQFYAKPEVIGNISKNNFRPIPKIDSAIIRLQPKSIIRDPQLFNLIRAGFSEKRKQLAGTLPKKLKVTKEKILEAVKKTQINEKIRAENLSLVQWIELKKHLDI
ncbi:MAG: ribosomal RNA small subunit methyltransferase A [Candidatus Yanofskybacteria bacterium]|nr:ribosomal RNA small subunit methyltransferase A [Candidatus Yanofskybacteria bacterium]